MWRIWRAPNNASRWEMGFNLVLKGLNHVCNRFFSIKNYTHAKGFVKVQNTFL
jgi:hypothetical protein